LSESIPGIKDLGAVDESRLVRGANGEKRAKVIASLTWGSGSQEKYNKVETDARRRVKGVKTSEE